jgi:hypothetical protein
VFSDLWRNCVPARTVLLGATGVGRWKGRTGAEGTGRLGASIVGSLVFFNSGAKSVCVTPMASATSTKTPRSRLSSSPSCSSLLSFQYVSPMWFLAWSHTMTRLLKVWNLRKPSCHRFCFLFTSWVKRHRNSATGAVCDAVCVPDGSAVLRRGAVIACISGRDASRLRCTTWGRRWGGEGEVWSRRDGGDGPSKPARRTLARDLARHYAAWLPAGFSTRGDSLRPLVPSRTRNHTATGSHGSSAAAS